MRLSATNTFGRRVKRVRVERGMSQDELARTVGVREKDISRWETDRNAPRDHETIVRLARALKVSTDYLLGASRKAGALGLLLTLPVWPTITDAVADSYAAMFSLL